MLLFELSDKRCEADAKHFMGNDRTFTAVKYPFAVHYRTSEDSEYIDIDNRMYEKAAETEEEILLTRALAGEEQSSYLSYFPASSPINAAISPDTDGRYLAAIENDGHILSWNYEEVHEGLYMEVTEGRNGQEEEASETDPEAPADVPSEGDGEVAPDDHADTSTDDTSSEVQDQEDLTGDDTSEVLHEDTDEMTDPVRSSVKAEPLILIPEDEELPAEREAVRYVASGLAFRNVSESMSLEYILSSDVMEESIVLEDITAAHSYHIVYDIGDLTIEQTSSNELILLDDEGKIIFTINAPFMKDANDQYSNDISFNIISEKDGKVLIEIIPDMDWLLSEERVYPVRIDPFIFQFTQSFHEDAAALYSHPSYPNGSLVIGNDNGVSYGKAKSYVKFTLPTLNKGDMVIGGILEISQYAGSYGYSHVSTQTLRVNAYEVTSSWTANQIISSTGYNNLPTNENTVLDYKDISGPNSSSVHYDFDISKAVKKWYEGSVNYGILLRAENETARALACFIATDNTDYPAYRPLLYVQYLNNRGLESYWTYHEIPIGDSGTLYVNDYTGNPVIIFPLASTPGSYAPASLSLVYNGYMSGETADEYTNPGVGFRLNVQERIKAITSTGSDLMQKLYIMGYRYIYTDSDGTQHYFEEDSADPGTYIDEEGLKLKLTTGEPAPAYYRLTSDDGSFKTFSQSGLLYQIKGKDGVGTITLSYNGGTISRIKDGANRYITVNTDSSGKVLSVTDPAGRTTTFSYYSGGGLASLSYQDGTTVTVNYNGVRLKDIKARNGQKIRIAYQAGTDPHVTNRVTKVTEYGNSGPIGLDTAGQFLQFDYSELNETKFTDREGNTEVYQFDNSGRTVSVRDADGGAAIYKYYADHTGKKSNALMFSAYGEHFTENHITNSSFEDDLTGYSTTGTVGIETNSVYLGSKMGKITGGGSISRSLWALGDSGRWYTFSAYFRTEGISNAKLRLEFVDLRGAVIEAYETEETDYEVSSADRFMISGKAPSGTIRAKISLISSAGTVYTDCWQLEKSETLNHYNMITAGDFTDGINGWTRYQFDTSVDKVITDDGEKVLQITGNTGMLKTASQRIYIGKKANTKNFLMSAMVKMDSVPLTSGRHAGIGITAHYEGGAEQTQWADANPGVSSWQKVSSVFHFDDTRKIIYIDAFVGYSLNANTCLFDKVCLSSDQTGTAYTLDSNGNVITAADNAGQNATYTYTSVGEVAGVNIQNSQNYTFTYYSTSDPSTSHPHFLKTAESDRSHIKFGFNYDDDWLLTETRVTGNDSKYIREGTGYSSDHAFVTSKTDAAGNTAYYDYGSDSSGLLRSTTDPEGNTVYYRYDQNNGRMTGMSETDPADPEISYIYDTSGNLAGIDTEGTDYTFTYDQFGRSKSTEAGNVTLITNEYAANNGNLTKTTYGNGDSKNYSYDSLGRITVETLKDGNNNVLYSNSYTYNAFGLLGKVEDGRNGKVYDYSYDLTDRPLKVIISDGSVIQTKYNTMNAVTSSSIRFRGEAVSTDYEYSDIDWRPAKTTFDGAWEETYTYDSLGRVTEKKDYFDIGDVALTTYYNYVDPDPNDTNKTTALVDTVICEDGAGNEIYAAYRDYDYDANGRISQIKVKDSNGVIKIHRYVYDSKGQLVSHENGEDGNTYSYSYDPSGNILSVWKHIPPTGNLIGLDLPLEGYQYMSSDWGDLLTSCGLTGETAVNYDGMGNTTSIGNTSFTWEGRELVGWDNGTDELTFSYDPDGYRVSKTEGNVTTDYLVSGGKILAQHDGTTGLYFFYDSKGQIQAFSDGTDIYYYIKNAEGDILGIMETAGGDVVATYSYDDWGVPTVTNYDNSTIGDINPFRYRGYYYDSETGLYYLGSRYYNPAIGRFISADEFASTGQGFIGCNMFAYCGNDPINRMDSDGCYFIDAMVVGFAFGIAGQYIGDVIGNIKDGKSGVEIFMPTSSGRDYFASGLGGAIAAVPGLGLLGTVFAGAAGNVLTDAIKGNIHDKSDLIQSAKMGAIANLLGYGVLKGGAAIKVRKIETMPRANRKCFLRDYIFRNSQANVNKNMKTFASYTFFQKMGLVEKNILVFKLGVYSSVTSTAMLFY